MQGIILAPGKDLPHTPGVKNTTTSNESKAMKNVPATTYAHYEASPRHTFRDIRTGWTEVAGEYGNVVRYMAVGEYFIRARQGHGSEWSAVLVDADDVVVRHLYGAGGMGLLREIIADAKKGA